MRARTYWQTTHCRDASDHPGVVQPRCALRTVQANPAAKATANNTFQPIFALFVMSPSSRDFAAAALPLGHVPPPGGIPGGLQQ